MAMAVSAAWREYGSVTQGPSLMRSVRSAQSVRDAYTSRKKRSSASHR